MARGPQPLHPLTLILWAVPVSPAAALDASRYELTAEDEKLLDDLERTGVLFFRENSHPRTGLVKDRVLADRTDERTVASIAATGFGLTALAVAAERGYLPWEEARSRVLATLRYLWQGLPHEHGFFYHFVHWETGERVWKCELSSIDTAILLCGVLASAEYFGGDELRDLARRIYERADFAWLLAGGDLPSHGWKPEEGFLKLRWDTYSESLMLYILALGSPTHPIPGEAWQAWKRPRLREEGLEYIGGVEPLFVHQYPQAWLDLRGRRDAHADYFENSRLATEAHRRFCLGLEGRFPHFGADLWGITSSDSERGYVAWGGPPASGPLDGTVVPCAAAGSLPFLPGECLRTLRFQRRRHGEKAWRRYGFVDAFNPRTGWYNPDVIGIDVGITVLMAENLRSGLVWKVFSRCPAVERGLARAGFAPRPR
jgi:hypothetical protein